MTKCLYVGNLPRECTEDELRTLFGADGRGLETVTIALDKRTGKSRGFGFVDMATEEDAAAALAALKGTEMGGRALKFGTAYKRKGEETASSSGYDDYGHSDRPRRGGGGGRGRR